MGCRELVLVAVHEPTARAGCAHQRGHDPNVHARAHARIFVGGDVRLSKSFADTWKVRDSCALSSCVHDFPSPVPFRSMLAVNCAVMAALLMCSRLQDLAPFYVLLFYVAAVTSIAPPVLAHLQVCCCAPSHGWLLVRIVCMYSCRRFLRSCFGRRW